LVVFFALAYALLERALNLLLYLVFRIKCNVTFESFAEHVVGHGGLEPNGKAHDDEEAGVEAEFH